MDIKRELSMSDSQRLAKFCSNPRSKLVFTKPCLKSLPKEFLDGDEDQMEQKPEASSKPKSPMVVAEVAAQVVEVAKA